MCGAVKQLQFCHERQTKSSAWINHPFLFDIKMNLLTSLLSNWQYSNILHLKLPLSAISKITLEVQLKSDDIHLTIIMVGTHTLQCNKTEFC